MYRESEDNTIIITAFNRKLLRDLEELRNLLVRNKPESAMKKLNELIEDTKRDITEKFEAWEMVREKTNLFYEIKNHKSL